MKSWTSVPSHSFRVLLGNDSQVYTERISACRFLESSYLERKIWASVKKMVVCIVCIELCLFMC